MTRTMSCSRAIRAEMNKSTTLHCMLLRWIIELTLLCLLVNDNDSLAKALATVNIS